MSQGRVAFYGFALIYLLGVVVQRAEPQHRRRALLLQHADHALLPVGAVVGGRHDEEMSAFGGEVLCASGKNGEGRAEDLVDHQGNHRCAAAAERTRVGVDHEAELVDGGQHLLSGAFGDDVAARHHPGHSGDGDPGELRHVADVGPARGSGSPSVRTAGLVG